MAFIGIVCEDNAYCRKRNGQEQNVGLFLLSTYMAELCSVNRIPVCRAGQILLADGAYGLTDIAVVVASAETGVAQIEEQVIREERRI